MIRRTKPRFRIVKGMKIEELHGQCLNLVKWQLNNQLLDIIGYRTTTFPQRFEHDRDATRPKPQLESQFESELKPLFLRNPLN